MFKKLFASIGIGGAKVDTILERSEVALGDVVDGYVAVKGGESEQKIDWIEFKLLTKIEKKVNGEEIKTTKVITQGRLLEAFTIYAHEEKKIPFHITIPYHTPISINSSFPIWLETSLGIDNAIDPEDKDYIVILPSKIIVDCVHSLESLGFYVKEVDIEESRIFEWGYIQEFEFKPQNHNYSVKEIELIFRESEQFLDVFINKESKSAFLEMFDLEESHYKFRLNKSSYSLGEIRNYLLEIIQWVSRE